MEFIDLISKVIAYIIVILIELGSIYVLWAVFGHTIMKAIIKKYYEVKREIDYENKIKYNQKLQEEKHFKFTYGFKDNNKD